MGKVKLSPRAEEDLGEIYGYTLQTWGVRQADKYLDILDGIFDKITRQPQMGDAYPYNENGYRKIAVGRHLIFYRIEESDILVIRILHQHMDIEDHL